VLVRPQAELALLMSGSGGDFRKTFDLPLDIPARSPASPHGETRAIDVGRIDYTDHDGNPAARYFINIASFGLSGLVVAPGQRGQPHQAHQQPLRVLLGVDAALFGYRMPRVR
jgi:diacylglycerol kinase family enzyme